MDLHQKKDYESVVSSRLNPESLSRVFGKPGNPFELGDAENSIAKRNSVVIPEKMGLRKIS